MPMINEALTNALLADAAYGGSLTAAVTPGALMQAMGCVDFIEGRAGNGEMLMADDTRRRCVA